MQAARADDIIAGIRDYRQLSERIATAGQPTEDELVAVAQAGYEAVINLAMGYPQDGLPDEDGLVRSLGLEYVHIPVVWEWPTQTDLEQFFEVMDARQGQRLFIHCVANKRVSAFMALYRIHRLGWARDEALGFVDLLSFPPVWRAFIEEMLAASFAL